MFDGLSKESLAGCSVILKSNTFSRQGAAAGLPWIQVAMQAPYFVTDDGKDWHPVGQNDAITWVEMRAFFADVTCKV